VITCNIYDKLTPLSRVFLEKLTGSQLVKKFPAFYGNPPFITAFTSARHLSLSSARSIQSTYYPPIYAWVFQVVSFPQVSLPKPCIYIPSPPIRATCPAHLILLDVITRTMLGEQYKSFSSSLRSFLYSPVTSSLLDTIILRSTLFSNPLSLCSSLIVSDQVSHPYKTTGKIIVLYIFIFNNIVMYLLTPWSRVLLVHARIKFLY